MSLNSANQLKRREYEYSTGPKDAQGITDDNITIYYEIRDDSFSHAFGVERVINHEITRIEAYIPALDKWLDVTHMSEFEQISQKMLMEAIGHG